jgi:hypothetical protein
MNQVKPNLKFYCERTSWSWAFEKEFSLDPEWCVGNRKRACGRCRECNIGKDSP